MAGEPESTLKQGSAVVTNSWNAMLYQVVLRHRRGNLPAAQEEASSLVVGVGQRTEPLVFTYDTGAGSPYDYWWIRLVSIDGGVFVCKDSFYCSLGPEDDGNVSMIVDFSAMYLAVAFSKSSGCTVPLSRV
jgi:hypothetical protein